VMGTDASRAPARGPISLRGSAAGEVGGVHRVREIESLDSPALAPYRTMRMQADHYRDRVFIAEGEKVVRRLLESELSVISALMPRDHYERLRPMIEARREPVDVWLADRRLLETMTGYTMYQGLLACARIPAPVELEVALARCRRPRFLVALDALANAENIGAVARCAAAFGAGALILGETCAHPYLRRAVRTSMGAIFDLPVVETFSLAAALRELRRLGVHCVAAHPHEEERFLPAAGLRGDCCVVLGSEGLGITPAVLEACDEAVSVPMQGGVDSLNVAAAAAVFFYEVWRQRPGWEQSSRMGG
jgi:tRNA G18 (ribose-2'-O)-methylase SpoU